MPIRAALLLLALALLPDAALALDLDPTPRLKALGQGVARAAKSLDLAQVYNRPPEPMFDDGPGVPGGGADAGPSPLATRLDRLERDLRARTGEIEELQHKVQTLEEQLRAVRAGANPGPSPAPAPVAGAPAAPVVIPAPAPTKRGDAFDPAADPAAPGAPKPLGTAAPSTPLVKSHAEPGQPLDISRALTGAPAAPDPAATGAIAPDQPKDEYSEALATLRAGQHEAAEKALAAYIAKNPKGKLVPAATYHLGESFFLRGRHREAAEKYLEISTKYGQSAQAPDAMLRLGQSLAQLGAKEQACASFSEVGVKYPNASTRVKDAAAREAKKSQC
jgi:tol-pal system protein YbgF